MASGGIRQDFGTEENITPGEARTIRYRVTDDAGDPIANLAGYQFAWFLMRSAREGNGLTALAANALVSKEDEDIDATAPNVDVPLVEADLLGLRGTYWHELWRTDEGNERRLSYGPFVVID